MNVKDFVMIKCSDIWVLVIKLVCGGMMCFNFGEIVEVMFLIFGYVYDSVE